MPSDVAEGNTPSLPGWAGLEAAVHQLLETHASERLRAERAEARIGELETALRDVSGGRVDPVALADRVQVLERENRLLNERLERARDSVLRILGRMRFVEEEP